ncbi:MAG: hypothetical protein KAQ92_07585 [Candidatus Aenigmarchaeota archaeon]|nr:hypothetical protein [Candidatus Aenigmarchaeota archaeon]MCK5476372.1 hypothetical protein [Candidatus Aenigmarchaeota archaeon]
MKIKRDRDNIDNTFLRDDYDLIQKELKNILKKEKAVVIEQTGISNFFKELVNTLEAKYIVKLIKINVPLETCMARIEKRNSKSQIHISKKLIEEVNKKSISTKHEAVL